jgi:hypothetical protein
VTPARQPGREHGGTVRVENHSQGTYRGRRWEASLNYSMTTHGLADTVELRLPRERTS